MSPSAADSQTDTRDPSGAAQNRPEHQDPDGNAPWGLSPAVRLYAPVAISLAIQVPVTILVVHLSGAGRLVGGVSVILAAASALALLGARRWPGPTVAAVAAIATIGLFAAGAPFIALVFAIVSAVVRGARLWALLAVGTGWLVAVIGGSLAGMTWHPFRVALTTLGLAICFAIGEAIRSRAERSAVDRARLAQRRVTAEEAERLRIARELHDVLAHSLSQISVQSGVGLHLFDREPEKAREALASIRALSTTGLDEVRGVLGFLRGDEAVPVTPQPQLADLPALAEARSVLGLSVAVHIDLAPGDGVPSAVQAAAYRIAQESLTNVVRHSSASHATITVARLEDDIVLSVDDDGSGMPELNAAPGSGIRGMRERAELAGGSISIEPRPTGGTRIIARLPSPRMGGIA